VLLLHGLGSDHRLTFEATGWMRALHRAGRTLIAPDLPGHGAGRGPASHDPERYRVPRLVEEVCALLDRAAPGTAVDVVGYSLGARLAWELAARRPERVRAAVLAGFGPRAQAGAALVAQTASTLPGNDPQALAACVEGLAADPFSPEPAPRAPLLLAAGTRDELAEGMAELAAGLPDVRTLWIEGRNHVTAVSASRLKSAAVEFLASARPRPA